MKKLPYNFIYLKYFCDAARLSSISAAALENHVTQSAISQAIAKLEDSIGQELIIHQPNQFRLTSFGETLSQKSRELFSHVRSIEEDLIGNATELRRISFASMHSLSLKMLPKTLRNATKRWPKLEVLFRLGHTDAIKEMVKKGQVDFGLVLDNDDLSSFHCHEIHRGEYGLYVAKNCKNEKKLPFIFSEERKEVLDLQKAFKRQFGCVPEVLMEVSSWEVIARLAEEGLGIGFFPDYVAIRKLRLRQIHWNLPKIPYRVLAIFPRNFKLSSNIYFFLEICRSIF